MIPENEPVVADTVPPDTLVAVVADAAVPAVFWLSVGNVQFVRLPLAGVPRAPPEVT